MEASPKLEAPSTPKSAERHIGPKDIVRALAVFLVVSYGGAVTRQVEYDFNHLDERNPSLDITNPPTLAATPLDMVIVEVLGTR